jgi:hypothetical protein
MRIVILLTSLLLTGCLFNEPLPVKQVWPDVPKELLEACPDLKNIEPNTVKLSEIITVVSENYAQYYDCKAKVDDWIVWYNGQKKIHDGK